MCGIAGQLSLFSKKFNDKNVNELKDMLKSMYHRGPDDEGIFISNQLIMGMRRLSILDLDNGKQPIYNENQNVSVVFNGEIYNYLELRSSLIERGHVFYTSSDTEVLVHLYEEYGENFSNLLNGMFAYALWDSEKRILILSRDRVGEKPLYYSVNKDILYFSSEIKSILLCKNICKSVNYDSISDLLSYNYIPYPETAFKNIFRVEPGTTMIIESGEIKKVKYWNIPECSSSAMSNELLNEVDYLLNDSTRIRLRSDVETGAFLSGGIDSSLVVKYNRKNFSKEFKTFSIGFDEEEYNELNYAKKVSERYNTNNIYKIVKYNNFLQQLVDTIWYCENPHGDVSFTPTYILSDLASKSLKVVLTGDGGDEIFGGYDKYLSYKYDNSININDNFRKYFDYISVFDLKEKQYILNSEFSSKVVEIDSYSKIETRYRKIHVNDFLNKIMYFDTDYLLEGNNLVKPDRMGMAHSIEARYPILDYRIINLLFKVSSHMKIKNGEKKYLLKELLKNDFDDSFVYRKKQMFTVPIGEWFKSKYYKDIIEKIFLSERFKSRNYYNNDYVLKMFYDHIKGTRNYTREIRLILIIELWHRIFIDNKFTSKPMIEEII